jgi:selenocysteine lyase/cysteine desulfurase
MTGEPDRRLGRRELLVRGGALAGATSLAAVAGHLAAKELRGDGGATAAATRPPEPVPAEPRFALTPGRVQMASFLIAPHPREVREAIERHRRGLDADPTEYLHRNETDLELRARGAAAEYLGGEPEEVALTDSTTMGLGLLYGGLRLGPDEEFLTTEHDFYSTHESIRFSAARTGARVRRVRLYRDLATVSEAEIVESLRRALTRRTRVVAITWVHSSTGLKLPVARIAAMLRAVNERRAPRRRVLLAVDGVHGFGVEDERVASLGCDFFASGCHKWLFGPRGTGVLWGRRASWPAAARPVIPSFDGGSYGAWLTGRRPAGLAPGTAMTPGGFHSFEHRWALAEAFELHRELGPAEVARRTHGFARRLKQGLAELGATVVTPADERLSAGLVCFDLPSLPAREAVERLLAQHGVVASVTPYAEEHVRFGPSIVNSDGDVEAALEAVRALSAR